MAARSRTASRFALEVTDAILTVLPAGRVGIRIAPASPANDTPDSNPRAVFCPLVAELGKRGLAYVHVIEGATQGARENCLRLRRAARGVRRGLHRQQRLYARNGDRGSSTGQADMVAFGRPFISNPDLVERLRPARRSPRATARLLRRRRATATPTIRPSTAA